MSEKRGTPGCPFCGAKSTFPGSMFAESYTCGTRRRVGDEDYHTGDKCDKACFRKCCIEKDEQLKEAQAEIARLKVELESANQSIADLQHATGCRTVEDGEAMKEEFQRLQNRSFQCCFCGANCQTFSGLKIHSAKCEAHPQFKENELLRLAMGAEKHETVDSSGHGWIRVESPGGDLRRISPIDERVVELEQENELLRKDAERLDWVEEHLTRVRRPLSTSDSATMTIEWYADGVTEFVRAATIRAAIDAAKEAE